MNGMLKRLHASLYAKKPKPHKINEIILNLVLIQQELIGSENLWSKQKLEETIEMLRCLKQK